MNRIRFFLCALTCALLLGACSGPTAPDDPVTLAIAADPVGHTGSPVRLSARVMNTGWTPVWHYEGCGAGVGIGVHILDSGGNELLLHDPSMMLGCADFIQALGPGKELTLSTSFDGTMFVRGENGYEPAPVPPGTYDVRIGFAYSKDGSSPDIALARTASFRWVAPPPSP
jgi:hypothetical protein